MFIVEKYCCRFWFIKLMMLRRFCQLYENDLFNDSGKYIVPEKSRKRIYFGKNRVPMVLNAKQKIWRNFKGISV